jgi:hypothetical protein
MTAETDKSFKDFHTDKDGNYSRAQFIALAAKLIREGRRPGRIFRAMHFAAKEASLAHSVEAHYDFVCTAAEDTAAWKEELEPILDQMIAEAEAKTRPLDS